MQEQQPGQVIAPGSVLPSAPSPQLQTMPNSSVELANEESLPPVQPLTPQYSTPQAPPAPQLTSTQPADALASPETAGPHGSSYEESSGEPGLLTWTAAEYVHHEKDATWYGAYTLGSILLGGLLFLVTRDVVSIVIVVVAIAGLLFISSRQPKQQTYALDDEYIQIGPKRYGLHDFKAFSVDEDSPVLGVTLMPLKRFMPPITLYVDELHEQAVVDYVATFLPMEPHKVDAIDSLLRRLKF